LVRVEKSSTELEEIMLALVEQKFNRHPELGRQLLDTHPRLLVEGNYWHDNYWGDCACMKCNQKPGLNKLGKILMRVRADLKTSVPQSSGSVT